MFTIKFTRSELGTLRDILGDVAVTNTGKGIVQKRKLARELIYMIDNAGHAPKDADEKKG